MPVTVEILDGPLKGMQIELKPGMRIGRSGADLNLKDPKVSSIHAEIRMRTGSVNTLVLLDMGSTNGIKVKGKKVGALDLLSGCTFQVGNTILRVIETEGAQKEDAPTVTSTHIQTVEPPPMQLSDWRAHLLRTVSGVVSLANLPGEARVFDPPIKLVFRKGPQAGEEVILAYGPRKLGRSSAEIDFADIDASEVDFELRPLPGGEVEFRTDCPEVFLNGLYKKAEKIRNGDRIEFCQTKIEIQLQL
jgi:pSer/pThr/pTyr-binding forkhead associated (FHA) protein